eukprot:COSAG01_NODE_46804_length_396_cov_6.703704_1_plen_65_part_00
MCSHVACAAAARIRADGIDTDMLATAFVQLTLAFALNDIRANVALTARACARKAGSTVACPAAV